MKTADELGLMAGGLNRMLDNVLALVQSKDEWDQIQRSVMKPLDEVSGVADGDLTKQAEVSADMTGAMADSFNYMIDQLPTVISSVQSTSLQVSTAATRFHASADHLAGGAENQAGQITGTTAAIDEMAASIHQVSEKVVTSSAVAQKALTAAKQRTEAVQNTIDGITRIREQAQETRKRIKRLGETTQEIGQIVQLIDDIADRTSILALNASIQAIAYQLEAVVERLQIGLLAPSPEVFAELEDGVRAVELYLNGVETDTLDEGRVVGWRTTPSGVSGQTVMPPLVPSSATFASPDDVFITPPPFDVADETVPDGDFPLPDFAALIAPRRC